MGQLEPKFRQAFVIFNILYFVMGASLLAIGIYNIVSLLSFDVFARSVYLTGGVLFVMVGVAKIVLSILGILGFALQNKIILMIYTLVALFVILPTLTAGVFGLQQWNSVFDDVGVAMNRTFNSTSEYERTQDLRRQFRENFYCCGIMNGASDYTTHTRPIETAACNRSINFRTMQNNDIPRATGCQYYISDAIRDHLYYIGAIGLAFGFFEVLSAIVAMQNAEGL